MRLYDGSLYHAQVSGSVESFTLFIQHVFDNDNAHLEILTSIFVLPR